MDFTQIVHSPGTEKQKRKKRRWTSKSEQAKHVTFWRDSGQTQTAFCTEHNLDLKTFSKWIKNHAGSGACSVPASPINTPTELTSDNADRIEVILQNGITINLIGGLEKRLVSLLIQETSKCKSN